MHDFGFSRSTSCWSSDNLHRVSSRNGNLVFLAFYNIYLFPKVGALSIGMLYV